MEKVEGRHGDCGRRDLWKRKTSIETELNECRHLEKDGGEKKVQDRQQRGTVQEAEKEIQKLCREAKDRYYDEKCREIELLDKVHSHLLYQKVKKLKPKESKMTSMIKSKQGTGLVEKEEIMER